MEWDLFAIRKNPNPVTEALGLDVAALVGKRVEEIRSLLAKNVDVALIVAHEPVPPAGSRRS